LTFVTFNSAWQTAGRGGRQQSQQQHQPGSASRTPQNRSSNASPSQSQQHSAPSPTLPRQQQQQHSSQEARPPASNAWTQRQAHHSHSNLASPTAANSSNGATSHLPDTSPVSVGSERAHIPLNGFNAAEVKAFLSREPAIAPYKPAAPSTTSAATTTTDVASAPRSSGGAWGAKGATPREE
jgi:hypothetical protein